MNAYNLSVQELLFVVAAALWWLVMLTIAGAFLSCFLLVCVFSLLFLSFIGTPLVLCRVSIFNSVRAGQISFGTCQCPEDEEYKNFNAGQA